MAHHCEVYGQPQYPHGDCFEEEVGTSAVMTSRMEDLNISLKALAIYFINNKGVIRLDEADYDLSWCCDASLQVRRVCTSPKDPPLRLVSRLRCYLEVRSSAFNEIYSK